ncbi:hypothetical protein Tco_0178908 [Tanacetum coccineum]
MSTLVEFMIFSSADNRPPMLEKHLYDSWKSKMELYMQNREHERMILESVEHGLLIWPTIEENGVTRTKKYEALFATEKIQAYCDLKASNIILQGLPYDDYSLVNHHIVSKDLWERVQLLMQGTSLTKHERECKLYDAFDMFAHIKGESLHQYYLIFTQINSLLEEFFGELAHIDLIPPRIDEADFDPEDDIRLYESFHVDFYNVPSSPRPQQKKPPDDDVYLFDHIELDMGVLTTKVVDDISDNSTRELYVHVPNVLPILPTLYPAFDTLLSFSSENEEKVFNPGILISKEEKSPHLLSYRGFKVF